MLNFYRDDIAVAAAEVEGLREALKKAEAELAQRKRPLTRRWPSLRRPNSLVSTTRLE